MPNSHIPHIAAGSNTHSRSSDVAQSSYVDSNTSSSSSSLSDPLSRPAGQPRALTRREIIIGDINACIRQGAVGDVKYVLKRHLQKGVLNENQGLFVRELLTLAMTSGTHATVLNELIEYLPAAHLKPAICLAARLGNVAALKAFNDKKIRLSWQATASTNYLIPLQEAIMHGHLDAITFIQHSFWRSQETDCYRYFEDLLRNKAMETKTKEAIASRLSLPSLTIQKEQKQADIKSWYDRLAKARHDNLRLKGYEETVIDAVNALRAALPVPETQQSEVVSFDPILSTKEGMETILQPQEDVIAQLILMCASLREIKAQFLSLQEENNELCLSIHLLNREKARLEEQQLTSHERPSVSPTLHKQPFVLHEWQPPLSTPKARSLTPKARSQTPNTRPLMLRELRPLQPAPVVLEHNFLPAPPSPPLCPPSLNDFPPVIEPLHFLATTASELPPLSIDEPNCHRPTLPSLAELKLPDEQASLLAKQKMIGSSPSLIPTIPAPVLTEPVSVSSISSSSSFFSAGTQLPSFANLLSTRLASFADICQAIPSTLLRRV